VIVVVGRGIGSVDAAEGVGLDLVGLGAVSERISLRQQPAVSTFPPDAIEPVTPRNRALPERTSDASSGRSFTPNPVSSRSITPSSELFSRFSTLIAFNPANAFNSPLRSLLNPRLRLLRTGQTGRGPLLDEARENEVERKPAPYARASSEGHIGDEKSMLVMELRDRSRT